MADYGDDETNDVVDLLANVHKQHPKDPTFNMEHFQNHVILHPIGMGHSQNHI